MSRPVGHVAAQTDKFQRNALTGLYEVAVNLMDCLDDGLSVFRFAWAIAASPVASPFEKREDALLSMRV